MKVFFSHSNVIDTLDDDAKREAHQHQLKGIAKKLETFGAEILEVTRFNVAVELAEHRVHQLFEIEEHMLEGFVGKVRSKVHALYEHIDHIEICPPEGHTGS